MSLVTNVMIHVPLGDEHVIERINERLPQSVNPQLRSEQFRDVGDYAGGYKAFEAGIYLCAFNYMDEEVETIIQEELADMPDAQVWILGQFDSSFAQIKSARREVK